MFCYFFFRVKLETRLLRGRCLTNMEIICDKWSSESNELKGWRHIIVLLKWRTRVEFSQMWIIGEWRWSLNGIRSRIHWCYLLKWIYSEIRDLLFTLKFLLLKGTLGSILLTCEFFFSFRYRNRQLILTRVKCNPQSSE